RRIILSHSRIHEDDSKAERKAERKARATRAPRAEAETVSLPAPEKTTLGDLEALAALKEKLEKGE
ncbi:MAG: 30S ribosomal protein S1, partial [Muribaculaceae bacterium]|nr:30S ribosomal protein S1 [Muribaculaceae bacterium]